MANELGRYQEVDNFRVEAVEIAYLYKEEKLYRRRPPWQVDEGFSYSGAHIPKGKFKTVDEALEAVRKVFIHDG